MQCIATTRQIHTRQTTQHTDTTAEHIVTTPSTASFEDISTAPPGVRCLLSFLSLPERAALSASGKVIRLAGRIWQNCILVAWSWAWKCRETPPSPHHHHTTLAHYTLRTTHYTATYLPCLPTLSDLACLFGGAWVPTLPTTIRQNHHPPPPPPPLLLERLRRPRRFSLFTARRRIN